MYLHLRRIAHQVALLLCKAYSIFSAVCVRYGHSDVLNGIAYKGSTQVKADASIIITINIKYVF